jgi:hypothetical protein
MRRVEFYLSFIGAGRIARGAKEKDVNVDAIGLHLKGDSREVAQTSIRYCPCQVKTIHENRGIGLA